jgi:hypothetical protein
LAEYHKLLRKGCSRLVHQPETIIIMVGAIDASKAPRTKRNTSRPGKDLNAARIMQEADHPMKQNRIHRLTLNRTKAYTETKD